MQVLIYDGECNMCSSFIRFIVKMNKNPDLYITDFNSKWTNDNVKLNPNIDSMIFIKDSNKYIYSDSVINLLASTNTCFQPISILKIIPKTCRDRAYKIIAKNRRKIAPNSTCPLPTQKQKNMFLD